MNNWIKNWEDHRVYMEYLNQKYKESKLKLPMQWNCIYLNNDNIQFISSDSEDELYEMIENKNIGPYLIVCCDENGNQMPSGYC